LMAQSYNPYANSGGSFGAQPAYYAGLGRDYTTATGGNIFGGGNNDPYGAAPTYSGGGIGSDAARVPSQEDIYQQWLQAGGYNAPADFNDRFSAAPAVDYRLQPTPAQQLPQGIYDGVFAPTQPRAVTIGDDFQSRFGNWGGNAIPAQQPQPQPQQPNSLPPFWQGARDFFGADPKDQSRVPQSDGGYPGATNPNYQPGGMAPQKPFESWVNAS